MWDEFLADGVMGIGWDDLGDWWRHDSVSGYHSFTARTTHDYDISISIYDAACQTLLCESAHDNTGSQGDVESCATFATGTVYVAVAYAWSEHLETYYDISETGGASHDALVIDCVAVVTDLLDSLSSQGFRRILIVNGHGGNTPARAAAAEWGADHPESRVLYHDWWNSERVMARAMAKDPNTRYPTAEAFAEDAEDVAAGQPPRHARGDDLVVVADSPGTVRFQGAPAEQAPGGGVDQPVGGELVGRRSQLRKGGLSVGQVLDLEVQPRAIERRLGGVRSVHQAYRLLYVGFVVAPIVAAPARQVIEDPWAEYSEQLTSLGAKPGHALWTLLWDGRYSLVTAILAGFGRASAEVGAVMIVGGNIDHVTRVMTTAIALETSKGDLALALGLGLVLIVLSLAVNAAAFLLRDVQRAVAA